MNIDTDWFLTRIKESPYGSQRKLSPLIRTKNGKSLDQASLSLMLRGKRAMPLYEAEQLAKLLKVPLNEILRRAGVKSAAEPKAKAVTIYVDPKGGEVLLRLPSDPAVTVKKIGKGNLRIEILD